MSYRNQPDRDPSSGSKEKFSAPARIESFRHALRGVAGVVRTEHNAWIHVCATMLAIGLGFSLEIGRGEWLAVLLAIILVWAAEIFNTAIEMLCDVVSPGYDTRIKGVKDTAAGAVLICALGAVAVGLLVFGPRLLSLAANLLQG